MISSSNRTQLKVLGGLSGWETRAILRDLVGLVVKSPSPCEAVVGCAGSSSHVGFERSGGREWSFQG